MKKALLFISVLIFTFSLGYSQAKIKLDKISHNFGVINEDGGNVSTEFKITNIGNTPLIISKINTICGCTTPKKPERPIAPGQSDVIVVTYEPKNRPGSFNKSLTIISNAQPSQTKIAIKGEVIPTAIDVNKVYPYAIGDIRLKSKSLVFDNIRKGGTKAIFIEFYNNSDSEISVGIDTPNYISTDGSRFTVLPKKRRTIMFKIDSNLTTKTGEIKEILKVKTSKGVESQLEVNVTIE